MAGDRCPRPTNMCRQTLDLAHPEWVIAHKDMLLQLTGWSHVSVLSSALWDSPPRGGINPEQERRGTSHWGTASSCWESNTELGRQERGVH